MTGVLVRRIGTQRTDTDGRRPREGRGKDGKDAVLSRVMSARAAGTPRSWEGVWADYPSQSQEGAKPVDTLISDFWPPGQEERDFCYLSLPVGANL